jgi:hypothetical protein
MKRLLLVALFLSSCATTKEQDGEQVNYDTYPYDISCPIPRINLEIGQQWDDRIDGPNLKQAIKRCEQKFPHSPCLKTFTKISFQNYRAICAKRNDHVTISPEEINEVQKEFPDPEDSQK